MKDLIKNSCESSTTLNEQKCTNDKKSKVNLNSIYKKIFKMNKTQNQKKKIMKRDEYDREMQMKHRDDYGAIPIRRTHQQQPQGTSYYLCGGVSVEVDSMQSEQQTKSEVLANGSRSMLNQFMQVLGVELFEEQGLVEVKIQNTQKGLTNFKFLSEILAASSSDQMKMYGSDIESYYNFIQNLLRKKNMCEQVEGFNKFSEIVSNKFDEFDKFLQKTVQNVKKSHNIFTYRVYKFDLFDFEFKMKSYGYSEDFIKTLGYNGVQQFKDQIMHQGLPEIFTMETRQNIAKAHMKQISQKQHQLNNIQCKLVSLDGIEIDTHLDMMLVPFYDSNTPIYNNLFDCSAMIEISTYDISKTALRQVINMRREINYDFNDAIKQDIYYELESQLFVDKFYGTSPLKIKKQQPLNSQQGQLTIQYQNQQAFELAQTLNISPSMVKQQSQNNCESYCNSANEDTSADTGFELSQNAHFKQNSKVCGYRYVTLQN
ncbi:hypothetical protein ABPG74_003541 [Tetrahymena malaccensis]